jgi:hypothetical protein
VGWLPPHEAPLLQYSPPVRSIPALLVAAALPLATGGCAGIELTALGVAALSAGAGGVVKAGTEYTLTGSAYRTFSVSLDELSTAVRSTLTRLQFTVQEAVAEDHELSLEAAGIERTVNLRFTPISPAMTRLKVVVRQDLIRRDRATASELLAQIDRDVANLNSATDLR